MNELLREYLLAVQYFTRIPVTGGLAEWAGFSAERLRASTAHFPGIGWLVGIAACVAFAIASILLPEGPMGALAAAVACTVTTVLLTGGFHEDGLADLADGLGGSLERERALEIMKDSRIGSFGVLALVLALAGKLALLALLAQQSPAAVLVVLVGAHAVSRFWPLVIVYTLPHIGQAGTSKSKPLADRIERRALAIAAAWCLPPLALMALVAGFGAIVTALLASGAALWAMRRLLQRRLQGFTGDGLGAAQQVSEIAFYFGAAMVALPQ